MRVRIARYVALGGALLLASGGAAVYLTLRSSLPQLEGEMPVPQLAGVASIERDENGVPTIRARSRRDLAFATGFAHAQDRYFQMDLMRRAAAGELAELLGAPAIKADEKLRIHGFRRVTAEVLARASETERELLEAYTEGANYALEQAEARPWEYWVLRTLPEPWKVEDCVLVAFSMYLDLNDSSGEEELAKGRLRQVLPAALFEFMHPPGTEWDAPVTGGALRGSAPPGPEVYDLRAEPTRLVALNAPASRTPLEERTMAGSNSWAVAATHTKDGVALLANDMHLGLRLPHVWYRARLLVESSGEEQLDLVGVTLPGLPMLIAGSNGHLAWGFTNSYGDWTDLVVVEPDPENEARYLTASGSEPFEERKETIEVRGGVPVTIEVRSTRWGPIVQHDEAGRPLALAWTAHRPQATNMHMLSFELARNVEQALDAANRAGGPVQNIVIADSSGRIGWSFMGQVPVRANYDSTVPASWRAPETGWTGWRRPEEYPRIIDPASGRLWTANTRTIDLETWLAFLGDGGYDLGARAAQIRDALLAKASATAEDMLAIQLDDRALFLARWRDWLLDLLDAAALEGHPLREEARGYMEKWSGHADEEDVGYRIVRAMRLQIRKDVFDALTAEARARFPQTVFTPSSQFEGPLWMLVTQRPEHLLDPEYPTWEAALLASVDRALAQLLEECGELAACTWGAQNTLSMRHPLSAALPFARYWLDMPHRPLPGDSSMPRVQAVSFGASERLVVSPGREEQGFLQMPGGPVDHPLSPFYGAGHEAWVKGEPTPLLPGTPRYTLKLVPATS